MSSSLNLAHALNKSGLKYQKKMRKLFLCGKCKYSDFPYFVPTAICYKYKKRIYGNIELKIIKKCEGYEKESKENIKDWERKVVL